MGMTGSVDTLLPIMAALALRTEPGNPVTLMVTNVTAFTHGWTWGRSGGIVLAYLSNRRPHERRHRQG